MSLAPFWDGPIGDGLDFLGLFLNPKRGDNETAEIDARHGEEALRPLGEELFCSEFGEDQAEVSLVVGFYVGVDDDVVDSWRRRFMVRWRVTGALQMPKGMTGNWKEP